MLFYNIRQLYNGFYRNFALAAEENTYVVQAVSTILAGTLAEEQQLQWKIKN